MSGSDSSGPMVSWGQAVLRGVGQVMFQDHALSGALFLIGIAFASPLMAAGGLAGAILGTLTAALLKYDATEIRDGIYGFNACLVGIAAFFFFEPVVWTFVLLAAGGVGAAVLTRLCRRRLPFPTYTAPFIVATWIVVAAGHGLDLPRVEVPEPPDSLDVLTSLIEGLSEVFLQANPITGMFFLAALAVSNWRHATLGMLGSLLGMLVALYHEDMAEDISIGIYGYNASLTAIALYLWRPSLLIPLLGMILSTPITEFFPLTGLPTLTAPFVLACWLILLINALEKYFVGETGQTPNA